MKFILGAKTTSWHPISGGKSEVMLLSTRNLIGPIAPALLGGSNLRWVSKTRLVGLTVDHRLTWKPHVLEIKKNFATKLDLLKRYKSLPTKGLRDFYFKVIYRLYSMV